MKLGIKKKNKLLINEKTDLIFISFEIAAILNSSWWLRVFNNKTSSDFSPPISPSKLECIITCDSDANFSEDGKAALITSPKLHM